MAEKLERTSVCRNCGAPVASKFCPDCGQETSLHPLSVVQFIQDVVSHYVAAEGKLWRTLALLALQPGRLTVEYLAGRRQRYIVPIRLYLTASFLFFAAAQISGQFMQASVADTAAVSPALTPDHAEGQIFISPVLRVDRSDLKDLEDEHFADCERLETHCSAWKRWLAPTMVKLQQDPQEFAQRFAERFRHALSYAMFLLLPVFASLLALAYQSRKMYYGEHLIFALHVHSFWFLLALLGLMLPEVVGAWLPLGFLTYGFWSLHRVYGGPWRFTLLSGSLIALTYALAMGIASALLSAALLST